MSEKASLRRIIKERIRSLNIEERQKDEELIFSHLLRHERFVKAQTVLLFHSLPDEVDTHSFVDGCSKTKRVLLPVVEGDDLRLKQYVSKNELAEGAFHISEPQGEVFTHLDEIDLILVPGVAFTLEGKRLGRGKGYYDKLLACPSLHNTYKIGVCYPCQLLTNIPTLPYDIWMDEVVTAN